MWIPVIFFNHNSILQIENIVLYEDTQKEKVSKKGNLQYVMLVFLSQYRSRYFVFQQYLSLDVSLKTMYTDTIHKKLFMLIQRQKLKQNKKLMAQTKEDFNLI